MALKKARSCRITNFVASSGWLQSFKKRHQIRSKMICGESGIVYCSVIGDFKTLYHEKIRSFNPDDVFNCDETGLFFSVHLQEIFVILKKSKLAANLAKSVLHYYFVLA
ncbi:Tigger transposable element-derived protein 6 [Dictyocoela muelleri]|nr:Tigger transposable element-derived protein 6 [Dictyocoela muelleri]